MHLFRLARPYILAVLALCAIGAPILALAEQPSVIAPPPTGSVSAVALGLLGPVVGWIVNNWGLAIVLAVLGFIGRELWKLRKLAAEKLVTAPVPQPVRHAGLTLLQAAGVGVGFVEQKVTPQLRDQNGKLPPEAQKIAFDAAVKAALEWLSMQGLTELQKAWNMSDDDLKKQLGVAIEATVSNPNLAAPVPQLEATGPADKELRATPSGRPIVAVAGKGG